MIVNTVIILFLCLKTSVTIQAIQSVQSFLEKISDRGIHDKALYHDFIMILSWFQNFIMKLSILLSWFVFCYHEPQMLYHEFYLLSWYSKLIHRKVSKLLEFGIKIYFTLSWFYHEPKILYHDFFFVIMIYVVIMSHFFVIIILSWNFIFLYHEYLDLKFSRCIGLIVFAIISSICVIYSLILCYSLVFCIPSSSYFASITLHHCHSLWLFPQL